MINKMILPAKTIGSDVPHRTASFINATVRATPSPRPPASPRLRLRSDPRLSQMAPGLSSFTFINEFGGPGAAGIGSLMDIR